MKKTAFILLASLFVSSTVIAGNKKSMLPKDEGNMDKFVTELMSKMTLQEKLGQLNLPVTGNITTGQAKSSDVAGKISRGEVGGLFNLKGVKAIREMQELAVEKSRLGIPLLFGMDVIHGYETVFPIPLALSCTWDMEAVEKSARIAAIESSADGICWTFSPMVDICRDARWGRVSEGNGEDPYLGSEIAKAMVRGYQGKDMSSNTEIMSCVKHFALYGAIEAGRDYNTVDMSRNRMYNEFFPPYKAAAEEGAGSFMSSFNEVDGVPATANRWLMTDVLRNQWGFDGFVVTDYTAIYEMTDHGIGDLQEVSARALKAGTDMDMVSDGFIGTLEKSLKEGKVTMEDIDRACRRMLEAKYKLGLFKDPYKYCDLKRPAKDIFNKEHRKVAREIATKSFVLLKNENNMLPLKKKGNIALIGPLANTRTNMPGTWSVAATPDRYSTLLEGLKNAVEGKANVLYAQGSNLMYDAEYQTRATMFGREIPRKDDKELLQEAIEVAKKSDVIVAALGESSEMSGESSSRSELRMPDAQHDLLKALLATGKPVILLHFSGRPTVMTWENENVPAILNVWFGGSESADAICDVLFGDVVPSGKLTTTFPQNEGQLPLYYNHKNTGRPLAEGRWFEKFRSNYIDVSNDPLYPFGYGLSYTTFSYSDMKLSNSKMDANGNITASIVVKNTGNYDADEVVQLYIRDVVGSITRPVKELKGFKRIHLKKGESQVVEFTITPEMLKFYDYDLNYVCEPGDFDVMIGPNSKDVTKLGFTLM
ncbi:Periplasmic beta-glucosidase precursor [uncultured Bacteroides sp.]|uniref:beta-glucosidase BglX n=1 Tax=Bacteroides cellulolyticus TaxID=2981780 RepID=UPI0008205B12|nr:beta-glucosidase BglX [Bacteroides cellulolyticus]MCU6771115.1 beta-glucosidase BglX [Bacteroides cellulolyticus]SCH59717.1 Periplasmic beta-glucosidase precursor [uncultured Bacteroides sp.]